ncbi:MAG: tRNA (N(6)-L-threonylcarbamoyladenosine(37)-C(2))-methylthiotransferase MtaB [Pseudomonadota bacterium]
MKYFKIITLGCKVNQCESAYLAEELERTGWTPAPSVDIAKLCIINTCTVTGKAAMQSRQELRRIIRQTKNALVIATGCYAQTSPDDIASIPGVAYVIGNSNKVDIPRLADNSIPIPAPNVCVPELRPNTIFQDMPAFNFSKRTRAFLKIQDGCDASCSYCIVPKARGGIRSLPFATALEHIQSLVAFGYREIVLTGIHLGKYGVDISPQTRLLQLLKEIEKSSSPVRIRISSIEPAEISKELIDLIAHSSKICHHLHIPLQSGDDNILKRMNRSYSASYFEEIIQEIAKKIPDINIGCDILVGFPGETETCFRNTLSIIKRLPIAYLHIFPFSRRADTAAYSYPDQLHPKIIKKRCDALKQIDMQKRFVFYSRFIGQSTPLLIERERGTPARRLKGLTGNYIPVLIEGEIKEKNNFINVTLTMVEGGKVTGYPSIS